MTSTFRVLVAADDPLARAGLANLLETDPSIEVVGQTEIGENLGAAIEAFLPDVVALDTGWDSGAAIEFLSERDKSVRWVVLVADENHALDAFTSGADAILLRGCVRRSIR